MEQTFSPFLLLIQLIVSEQLRKMGLIFMFIGGAFSKDLDPLLGAK